MTPRLLVSAAALAFAAAAPVPANAIGTPVGACTSLVAVCAGSCLADTVVQVTVVGDGYGEAFCGSAFAWCETRRLVGGSDVGTCQRSAYVADGGSTFVCRAEPYGTTETVAICVVTPGAA